MAAEISPTWQRSLALPPLDRLPERDVLADFVARARPWGRVRATLSPTVVGALWTVWALNLALGTRLLALPCSGIVCTAVTLDDHPRVTLALSATCAVALAVAAPLTQGLRRAGGAPLVLVVTGLACGAIALLGAVAVLVVALLGLLVVFSAFAFVVDRL